MNRHSILIIDDDPNVRKTLSDILGSKGYDCAAASSGAESLRMIRQKPSAVALIDLNLPDMNGIEVLKGIKDACAATQAIILTGNATLDSAIEATNKGAFSFLLKPYDIDMLLQNIGRAIEKQQAEEKLRKMGEELEKKNKELQRLYDESKTVSLHDPLTGLANRRLLDIQMEKSIDAAKRYGEQLSVLMIDIDHFKQYNDTHGHLEGDRLLTRVAGLLSGTLRAADYVFRYGGEEFLVLLPKTDCDMACIAAERLRKIVETEARITVSIGICHWCRSCRDKENLITAADKAMYQAKQKGRNRAEVFLPGDNGLIATEKTSSRAEGK